MPLGCRDSWLPGSRQPYPGHIPILLSNIKAQVRKTRRQIHHLLRVCYRFMLGVNPKTNHCEGIGQAPLSGSLFISNSVNSLKASSHFLAFARYCGVFFQVSLGKFYFFQRSLFLLALYGDCPILTSS